MQPLLLSSYSLMSLIQILTAAVLISGLRRTEGQVAYKPWLMARFYGHLLWQGMNFINSAIHPDLIAPVFLYTITLSNVGFYLSYTTDSQLAYLFPVGAFERERKWVLRSFFGLGILFAGVQIGYNFFFHPPRWSPVSFAGTLVGLFSLLSAIWLLLTYLRKARYFRQRNPALVMPSLLMAGFYVGSIGISSVLVYPGNSAPWVLPLNFYVVLPLLQYFYLIFIIYSTFPIRFQDKLIGFAFASVVTILSYTTLLLIPYTRTIADQLAHQHELRILALLIIGSAGFVLWVFPFILRVSLIRPLGKLLEGIKQANEGDLSVQVPVGMLDEFGTLTHNFNQMTQSLKQSKDELTEYAETLEVKVADRTAELNSKNQELIVEAALEKVRSRSLAMQHSDELKEVITLVFQQLNQLNINLDGAAIISLYNENSRDCVHWTVNPNQTLEATFFKVPYFNHPFLNAIWEAVEKGEDFTNQILTLDEKKSWLDGLFMHTDYQYLPEELKQFLYETESYALSIALEKYTCLMLDSYSGKIYLEQEIGILKRFARVFDQAYTRFLDIQKAEAQVREAQIEAALERVRSSSMAMQTSEELKEVITVVFDQLQALGFVSDSANFVTDFNEKGYNMWLPQQINLWNKTINVIYVPYADDVIFNFFKQNFKGENHFATALFTFEEKNMFFNHFFANTAAKYVAEERKQYDLSAKGLAASTAFRKNFCLSIVNYQGIPYAEDQNTIVKRFATVFEQSYTRFLDLQKAEEQALDVLRRSTVDRLRAEIASMRTTGDLERITPLIWNELNTLGVPFIRCGVFIMDEEQQQIHTFLSTPDGKAIASFNTPFANPGILSEALPHWRNKEIYKTHWDEATFLAQAKTLFGQGVISSPETYLTENRPTSLYLHLLPFLQGMLYVGNDTAPLTDDQLSLVQTLADAFSTAYARYEDFNKLEEAKKRVESTLTELKTTQTQLIQKEKMASLGELTAGIAHEIQNPLNFVNNFAEVSTELAGELKDELQANHKTEALDLADNLTQNLEKITLHGRRASSIVKGMLEHSRTASGERQLTNLNALADEYLRLSYQGLRAKDKIFTCELITNFAPDLGKVEVVPQDIGRVLLNLFNNAFYAVAQRAKQSNIVHKPTVSVSTRFVPSGDILVDKSTGLGMGKIDKGVVEIRVMDNGMGIPEAVREKIFQPFFTTKPTGEGTGLGLSLSYDIITKGHGGTMEVESVEGEHTTFVVRLPVS